jgi:anti-sigma-K factor RskA
LADGGLYTAYRERATGEPAAVLAVNVAPGESELTPIDTTELLLGVRTAIAADSAKTAGAVETPQELERRQNPWRVLLMMAAAVLLLETLLATTGRRGLSRRTASPLVAGPPSASSEER